MCWCAVKKLLTHSLTIDWLIDFSIEIATVIMLQHCFVYCHFRRLQWTSHLPSTVSKPTISNADWIRWSTDGLQATGSVPNECSLPSCWHCLPSSTPAGILPGQPVPAHDVSRCSSAVWAAWVPWRRGRDCGYCTGLGWKLVLGQKDSPYLHQKGLCQKLISYRFLISCCCCCCCSFSLGNLFKEA